MTLTSALPVYKGTAGGGGWVVVVVVVVDVVVALALAPSVSAFFVGVGCWTWLVIIASAFSIATGCRGMRSSQECRLYRKTSEALTPAATKARTYVGHNIVA